MLHTHTRALQWFCGAATGSDLLMRFIAQEICRANQLSINVLKQCIEMCYQRQPCRPACKQSEAKMRHKSDTWALDNNFVNVCSFQMFGSNILETNIFFSF